MNNEALQKYEKPLSFAKEALDAELAKSKSATEVVTEPAIEVFIGQFLSDTLHTLLQSIKGERKWPANWKSLIESMKLDEHAVRDVDLSRVDFQELLIRTWDTLKDLEVELDLQIGCQAEALEGKDAYSAHACLVEVAQDRKLVEAEKRRWERQQQEKKLLEQAKKQDKYKRYSRRGK